MVPRPKTLTSTDSLRKCAYFGTYTYQTGFPEFFRPGKRAYKSPEHNLTGFEVIFHRRFGNSARRSLYKILTRRDKHWPIKNAQRALT